MTDAVTQQLLQGLSPAYAGKGALLQRDYWAVIRECSLPPSGVIALLQAKLADFVPAELAAFSRPSQRQQEELALGEELEVKISGAGRFRVRVVHQDRASFTLATLMGHPEAGRITFGAYRNAYGDVLMHIRSRARFRTTLHGIGFLLGADALQTNTWTELINRVALTCGAGVVGSIHVETTRLAAQHEREDPCSPTYLARGE